ncbi:MAG: ABC transporter substrate-binding protein/permease [Clostridiales bacterium]|jgi:putative lysine transport system permease protein|nr:ABC transporter substrate-binding protein/permease [Clostridiales bacterium]
MCFKKNIFLLILFLFLFVSINSIIVDAKNNTKKNDFIVGLEGCYPPFNWTQDNSSNGAIKFYSSNLFANGYDVSIAKIIAKKLKKNLVILKIDWDGLLPALTSKKIDAIIAGMSPTEERKKSINFSDAYNNSRVVILVKNYSKFADSKTIFDFGDAKITAQLNTFHYDLISQLTDSIKQPPMDNFPAMRVALESNVIDGYITEFSEAYTAQKINKNFKLIELDKNNGFNLSNINVSSAIGVRKDFEDLERINNILKTIDKDQREKLMQIAIDNQPELKLNNNFFNNIIEIFKKNWLGFLYGALMTLFISFVSTIFGAIIGLSIGMFKIIKLNRKIELFFYKIIDFIFNLYIEIFRSTPMIVQAAIIYYGTAQMFSINLNRIFAAIFIVSINTGAYMSEVVRGGIISINKSQFESSHALGLNNFQTLTKIIMPQVLRNIIPSTINEFVINIKDTAVLNIISVFELFFEAKSIAGTNFKFFETYTLTCLIYFLMTFCITRILLKIEKKIRF